MWLAGEVGRSELSLRKCCFFKCYFSSSVFLDIVLLWCSFIITGFFFFFFFFLHWSSLLQCGFSPEWRSAEGSVGAFGSYLPAQPAPLPASVGFAAKGLHLRSSNACRWALGPEVAQVYIPPTHQQPLANDWLVLECKVSILCHRTEHIFLSSRATPPPSWFLLGELPSKTPHILILSSGDFVLLRFFFFFSLLFSSCITNSFIFTYTLTFYVSELKTVRNLSRNLWQVERLFHLVLNVLFWGDLHS